MVKATAYIKVYKIRRDRFDWYVGSVRVRDAEDRELYSEGLILRRLTREDALQDAVALVNDYWAANPQYDIIIFNPKNRRLIK